MYEFDLGEGVKTPTLGPELGSVHDTRERMIMPVLDRLFPGGLAGARCLDVGCNEGYFAHLLYRRGARVTGIDIRPLNIERARLVQRILGLDPARLTFDVQSVFDNQDAPDTYEVTLCLGLIYHLENPMGALRVLQRITRTLCVVESQLTRHHEPIVSGCGQSGVFTESVASLSLIQETDMRENRLAAYECLSFVPNAAAVRQMLFSAGFAQVAQVAAAPGLNPQYVSDDRGVFFAWT
jgi:2-polyprenyl-3-methyl-5-hydroxy-6-metoxy-1,4-benzoquinol methylase